MDYSFYIVLAPCAIGAGSLSDCLVTAVALSYFGDCRQRYTGIDLWHHHLAGANFFRQAGSKTHIVWLQAMFLIFEP